MALQWSLILCTGLPLILVTLLDELHVLVELYGDHAYRQQYLSTSWCANYHLEHV